jgi:hypothetical protein
MRKKIFVETTIHIERLFSDAERQAKISKNLKDAVFSTSSYVYMEFRRTMLQAISYVLSVARQMLKEGQKNIDLVSLLRRLSAGTAISFSLRNFQRVMLIYSYLLDHFSTFIVPAAILIDYLEYNRDITIPERFFESIDEYINHTNCDLVRHSVPVGDYLHRRLSCNARSANCALVSFLQQHQAELHQLELALAAAAPEKVNPRTLAALKKINVDILKALGQRTCWHLGDVIIALEAPDDAKIYTTDGHFDLICSVLGKQLFGGESGCTTAFIESEAS